MVPLLVVVVVVELFVVLTGHETLCAWMTTPGPKLQLLAGEGEDADGLDPAGDVWTPLARLSKATAGVVIGTSPTACVVFTIFAVMGANGVSVVVACGDVGSVEVFGEGLTVAALGDVVDVGGVATTEGTCGAAAELAADFGAPVVAAAVAAVERPKLRKVAITTRDCRIRASALRRTNNRPGRSDRRVELVPSRCTRLAPGTDTPYP